ncbi:MAG: hypothetical protein ACYC9O_06075 [Candidatus Latescibacterota bacterium]
MNRRNLLKTLPAAALGLNLANAVRGEESPYNKSYTSSLACGYVDKVTSMLLRIRETQMDNLMAAAFTAARTIARGGTCWSQWDMGHTLNGDLIAGRDGLPAIFTVGYDMKRSKTGDMILTNIYGGERADIEQKKIVVVGGPAPWGLDVPGSETIEMESARRNRIRDYADIWIDTGITVEGAVMKIPGMPHKAGPTSGILGEVTIWMLMAETCRLLALDGKSVPVSGDEPRLEGKDIPWIPLHDPILDDYLTLVLEQFELIGAEYGSVKKIAAMAVDAILAGHDVYTYNATPYIAEEANTRRGGLALGRGVYEAEGKLVFRGGVPNHELRLNFDDYPHKGDMVIMSHVKPDDKKDLAYLDKFRKYGMKVASIGPMTRSVPALKGGERTADPHIVEGRILPHESDIHLGRMCDTFGLYAVPGFERRICPTTGPLVLQMYWTVVMEIIEEVIRRTGDIPYVFPNVAQKNRMERMYRFHKMSIDRGY